MSVKETLRTRAEKFARPAEKTNSDEVVDVVEFILGGEKYAFESTYIREVYPYQDLTWLPGVPDFVMGIINVRRKILSVIDLRVLFGLPINQNFSHATVIILGNNDLEFGCFAEAINGSKTINKATMQISLPPLMGVKERYIKGITPDRLVILDGEKLLSDKKIIVNENMEG
jgi:purine-binding chemotaxis protein CheW